MTGGCLYQLKTAAAVGHHVIIGGPYDTYGRVIAYQESGFHLIRGLGHIKPENITVFYATETIK
jgi:hypothetical protein